MWEYILDGATIFCLIVALGALLNGKVTRERFIKFLRLLVKVVYPLLKFMKWLRKAIT